MMRHSRGQYTERHVTRCSRLGGQFGKDFDENVVQKFGFRHLSPFTLREKYVKDVPAMVQELRPDALFAYIPLRSHKAYPHFSRRQTIDSPEKMGHKLKALSKDIDFWIRQRQMVDEL